jgi:hypothetical protein
MLRLTPKPPMHLISQQSFPSYKKKKCETPFFFKKYILVWPHVKKKTNPAIVLFPRREKEKKKKTSWPTVTPR